MTIISVIVMYITQSNARRYVLGHRTAIDWVLDQHKEWPRKDPVIRERFDTYRFADCKEQVIDLRPIERQGMALAPAPEGLGSHRGARLLLGEAPQHVGRPIDLVRPHDVGAVPTDPHRAEQVGRFAQRRMGSAHSSTSGSRCSRAQPIASAI